MGRVFEALRPYIQEFCDQVDPLELMDHLMQQLSLNDVVGLHSVCSIFSICIIHFVFCNTLLL